MDLNNLAKALKKGDEVEFTIEGKMVQIKGKVNGETLDEVIEIENEIEIEGLQR